MRRRFSTVRGRRFYLIGLTQLIEQEREGAASYFLDHAERLSQRGNGSRSKMPHIESRSSSVPSQPLLVSSQRKSLADLISEEVPRADHNKKKRIVDEEDEEVFDWKVKSREFEYVYRLQLERGDTLTVTHKLFGTGSFVPDDLRLLRVHYYRPSLFADLFRNAAITFTFEHYPGRKTSLEEVAQLGIIVRQCYGPLCSIQFEQPTGAFVYGKLYELQEQLLPPEKRYLRQPK